MFKTPNMRASSRISRKHHVGNGRNADRTIQIQQLVYSYRLIIDINSTSHNTHTWSRRSSDACISYGFGIGQISLVTQPPINSGGRPDLPHLAHISVAFVSRSSGCVPLRTLARDCLSRLCLPLAEHASLSVRLMGVG